VTPEAYEAFLKGRHLIEHRTEESLREGLAVLAEAVRLDPTLELAHVGVADAYNLMGFMTVLPPREAFPKAQAAARLALALNPAGAEALTSLAYATLWHDWDFEESERLFRRSIDLNPKYALAHLWFANTLLVNERFEEADAEARVARTLDPRSNVAIAFQGWFPYWRGRFEESARRLEDAIRLTPDFGLAYYWLGLALARAGRDTEAVAALERFAGMLGRTPQAVSALAVAHALGGRGAEARALLHELEALGSRRYAPPYYAAQVWAALGERDAAFAALDRSCEERVHWLAAIRIDPSLAPLRGDARFEALAARIHGGRGAG
jgi:tetratricopeptide (TPR) repeat protein